MTKCRTYVEHLVMLTVKQKNLLDYLKSYYSEKMVFPTFDEMRDKLMETDRRLGEVLDMYERNRVFDKTVFVLTADHGMEMQDPTRIHTPLRIFADRNSRSIMKMIYLNSLEESD